MPKRYYWVHILPLDANKQAAPQPKAVLADSKKAEGSEKSALRATHMFCHADFLYINVIL